MADTDRQPYWLTVFLDYPSTEFDAGTRFWLGVTGYARSPLRGEHREFASLVPAAGDEYLKVQRLGDGPTRLHLDLHVPDPFAAAEAAEGLGADLVAESAHGYFVLRSPAGITFCLVGHPASDVPAATLWPGGSKSRVSEVCLDIPRDRYDIEAGFWRRMVPGDWAVAPDVVRRPADGLPVALRLEPADLSPMGSAHLHVCTGDPATEAARLMTLGARQRFARPGRIVLEAPGGTAFCVVEPGT